MLSSNLFGADFSPNVCVCQVGLLLSSWFAVV